MNETVAIDLLRDGIWTALLIAAPALVVAMVVGVGIALVQALTQIQEMTLTFVPKIVAILVVVAVSAQRDSRARRHDGQVLHLAR